MHLCLTHTSTHTILSTSAASISSDLLCFAKKSWAKKRQKTKATSVWCTEGSGCFAGKPSSLLKCGSTLSLFLVLLPPIKIKCSFILTSPDSGVLVFTRSLGFWAHHLAGLFTCIWMPSCSNVTEASKIRLWLCQKCDIGKASELLQLSGYMWMSSCHSDFNL